MKDIIVSSDNKFYKLLKKLDKKKYREENSIFKAEGEKFLNEDINFNKIIVKESKFEYFNQKYSIERYDNLTILKDKLFDQVSTQENSQGIIFLYTKNLNMINDINGDCVIVDDIQDPGNIGTIARTMVAADFRNLILTKGSVDIYNPKTVRAAMGGIFKLNIIYETPEKIMEFLKKKGYFIVSTALHKDSVSYEKVIQKENGKNAYIFGHEGGGVSDYFLEKSDIKAVIPLYGNIESLNVSVAVGIFLYKMRERQNEIKLEKAEIK